MRQEVKIFFWHTVLIAACLLPLCARAVGAEEESCLSCHKDIRDSRHAFSCTQCHEGDGSATGKEKAHQGLVAYPAAPQHMMKRCGGCHGQETNAVSHSSHFTLKKMVNRTRKAFGARSEPATYRMVQAHEPPATKLDLVDDLLLRRCFRCHIGGSGERYSGTRRGRGCAACHMPFENGKPRVHQLVKKPEDFQCLACHHGNRVGSDYYGMFEQDTTSEYRTPFVEIGDHRSYGIETHRLSADIHKDRGLLCVDCHIGPELHAAGAPVLSCSSCHVKSGDKPSHPRVEDGKNGLYLPGAGDGRRHPVPRLVHPAHKTYAARVSCQVCHARWSFQDTGRSYLRHDDPDPDDWWFLQAQGMQALESFLAGEGGAAPGMQDLLTGKIRTGYWLKSFGSRRWETVPVGRDASGTLKVIRPLFDISLSYINADEDVVFDGITPSTAISAPYVPHTTGHAGVFYLQRLEKKGIDTGMRQ